VEPGASEPVIVPKMLNIFGRAFVRENIACAKVIYAFSVATSKKQRYPTNR
jgi:hypothetical protein